MIKQPRNYQITAIERGDKQNLGIFDQMGLGKSLEAIEICKAVFDRYNAPVLIVCPKTIRQQWCDMIYDQDPTSLVCIYDNPTIQPYQLVFNSDYVITHYEFVTKYSEILKQITFSTFVLDEAHRIKTRTTIKRLLETKHNGKRVHITAGIKKLKAYRKLALTGTPYDKNPAELWSILNFLEPNIFSSYWRFFNEHITFDVDYWGYKKDFRLKDPSRFASAIAPYIIRRTKRQVMPELPPMIVSHIPIELNQKQREIYERIKRAKDLDVDNLTIPNVLAKIVRLHQIASNPKLLNYECSSAKIDWLKDWLADNPDETCIIFTRYKLTASALADDLAATCVIGGKQLTTPLTASRRIVGTIAALGTGHDLGHISTAIYLDSDYDSILMDQSKERIDRGNNTEPKNVIYLHAQNTVDDLIKEALDKKFSTKQLVERFLYERSPDDSGYVIA